MDHTLVHTGADTLVMLFPLSTQEKSDLPSMLVTGFKPNQRYETLQINISHGSGPGQEPASRARRAERKPIMRSLLFPAQLGAVT